MKVVFFHRKPRSLNFSIENLFIEVRSELPSDVQWKIKVMHFFSNGFFKRLYIGLEACFSQQEVNHVTGDIHFITLFLRSNRTVLTIHDIGLINHPNKWIRSVLCLFWITLPVKKSTIVTTVSMATKLELLKYVKVNPEKIRVIYNPVSPLFVKKPKEFNKLSPVILQIGTKHNKNVVRLIKALTGISCTLEIIGEPNDEIKRELIKSELTYTISHHLTNDQVVKKYQEADVIAFVSTHEGFGMPIIEANRTGRVVVTSNVSSMPEVAGTAAHLVDPFNIDSIREGMLKVIEDDNYREQLITNGFINQKRFEASEIARQYTEVYKYIIQNQ